MTRKTLLGLRGAVLSIVAGPAFVARFSGDRKDDSASKKKLVIENLYIRDAQVTVNSALTSVVTAGKAVSSPVPDLHLRDIGKSECGASPGEVSKQVSVTLTRSIGNVASKIGVAITEGVRKLFN